MRIISEFTQGTVIHRIRAVDGDFGAPRNMSYLSDPRSDWADFFRIEPHTGDLSLLRDGKELIERSCTVSLSILKVTVSIICITLLRTRPRNASKPQSDRMV